MMIIVTATTCVSVCIGYSEIYKVVVSRRRFSFLLGGAGDVVVALLLLSLSPFLQLFYAYEESCYPVLYASVVVYRTLYTDQML